MLVYGSRNHLIEFEIRISILAAFLIENIFPPVIGTPPQNGTLEFVEVR